MKPIPRMLTLICTLFISTFVAGFSQQAVQEPIKPSKTVHLHLLDLIRVFSPGLKVSLEVFPNDDFSINYEASFISDFNGKHIMSYFNNNNIKFVNGFSLGFYPMVRVNRNDFAGFRVNYSLKYREINDWVPRFGGAYLQEMDYWHLTNSVGYYYRYMIKQLLRDDIQLSMALNAGIIGSYVVNNLPDDVENFGSLWQQTISNVKPIGFHINPHIYFEFNLSFPLQKRKS